MNLPENFKEIIASKKGFISDMDGVIYHGSKILPGVEKFIKWLKDNDKRYLFLTNSSERSPRELSQKLERLGLEIEEENFYTSEMATAEFLKCFCISSLDDLPDVPQFSEKENAQQEELEEAENEKVEYEEKLKETEETEEAEE